MTELRPTPCESQLLKCCRKDRSLKPSRNVCYNSKVGGGKFFAVFDQKLFADAAIRHLRPIRRHERLVGRWPNRAASAAFV